MPPTLANLTVSGAHDALLKKEFSALELTQAFFKHIREKDKEIGAYLSLLEDEAVKTAEGVDIALAAGEDIHPLAGVPIAVKDNILVKGSETTAGSKILKGYTAAYDAGVVQKLKKAQAVILGKTNLDEFAMGSSTENSGYQITRNPHDLKRVPGGSSGGSAAAVAGHMAVAALGSDTGGSIREPAAFSGVVGLKPTYGAVSRSGLIALASSLDQIGPLAKNVDDAAILFDAIRGRDALDSTSRDAEYGELIRADLNGARQLRVGLPREYFEGGLSAEVAAGLESAKRVLADLGVQFEEVSLPHTKHALSCYYIILPAEASANLARLDGIRYARNADGKTLEDIYYMNRGRGFGPEVKRRIILGTFVLSSGYYDAYYEKAQRVRAMIKQDFENAFKQVDVLLTPVTATPAFKIGEKSDPLSMYLSDVFTIPANLAGVPGISIPVRDIAGLPVGFQLLGRPFREADILNLGRLYESA